MSGQKWAIGILLLPMAAVAQEPWQSSWDTFLQVYQACLNNAACDPIQFADKEIVWQGTYTGSDTDASGLYFVTEMTPGRMTDRGGTSTRVANSLLNRPLDPAPWRRLNRGDMVRFRSRTATLFGFIRLATDCCFFMFLSGDSTLVTGPVAPSITSVINGASLLPEIAARSWITIRGSALSGSTRAWQSSDFVGNVLPASLDGVSVKVNGKDAPVYYISPGQLNVLAPADDTVGPVSVSVTTPQGTAQTTATLRRFAPAFFMFDPEGRKYLAAIHPDGTLAGKAGLFGSAATTRPLQAGGRVLLFGTGFGGTNPAVPTDRVFEGAAPLTEPVTIRIGGVPATVEFAGLIGVGLYQFNVVTPNVQVGDQPVTAEIGGVTSPSNTLLTIGSSVTPRLAASQTSLVFRFQQPGPAAAPQTLQITTGSGTLATTVDATTSKGGNWLRTTTSAITAPGSITVLADAAGLRPDTYIGSLRISAPGASNSPIEITVVFFVTAPTAGAYNISTFAGTGSAGFFGNGGPAVSAQMNLPFSVAVDANRNTYVAEFGNNRVRRIDPAGQIAAFAGTGIAGSTGDGGSAANAQLFQPTGVVAAPDGTVYIAEYGHRVRKVSPDGVISTVAGTGQGGGSGDGGPATLAQLNLPTGVALDDGGNLYVSESGGGRIRRITPAGVIGTVFQGLDRPDGVAVDRFGNVYAAEFTQVRRITPAGQASVVFSKLRPAVSIDPPGNLYVSDYNTGQIIRNPQAGATIIAGTAQGGSRGDGGPATSAQLAGVRGMAFFPDGAILVSEATNHRIRRLTPATQ